VVTIVVLEPVVLVAQLPEPECVPVDVFDGSVESLDHACLDVSIVISNNQAAVFSSAFVALTFGHG